LDCPLDIALGILRDWDKLTEHERRVVRNAIARLGTRFDLPAGERLHRREGIMSWKKKCPGRRATSDGSLALKSTPMHAAPRQTPARIEGAFVRHATELRTQCSEYAVNDWIRLASEALDYFLPGSGLLANESLHLSDHLRFRERLHA
jgi:hypothetical protein